MCGVAVGLLYVCVHGGRGLLTVTIVTLVTKGNR